MMKRFWDKVKKTDDCWIWIAATRAGYGILKIKGKLISSHRLSWELHFGKIPKGKFVCHHCDNRKCVRPDHLFLGTVKDNVKDAIKKEKMWQIKMLPFYSLGRINATRKLTQGQAQEIREKHFKNHYPYRKLMKYYKVSMGTIEKIMKGKDILMPL